MKTTIILLCILSCFTFVSGFSQISHGGKPLPYLSTKSAPAAFFESMPAFDLQELLRLDSMEYNGLRNSNRFAYKFMTDFTPDNAGMTYTLADGTRVWRLGIRSEGAVSINLLFTEYELPEGASLFVYDPEQKQIKGSFTSQNNSERHIQPVSPVYGDEIIVEYQEPAHSLFHGRLRIGEVNHAYRSLARATEPAGEPSSYSCILPLTCSLPDGDPYQKVGRSVVELIVDGTYYCTGSLINNLQHDGKPYLLTASHCLNEDFMIKNPDYEEIAGKIIAFFNYNSPTCESPMRGTEEMSMASAYYRAVNENTDMALLELTEIPPVYYRPYYAGWNASENPSAPFVCIQHPGGATKRFSLADQITLDNFSDSSLKLASMSFWHVAEWTQGCTAGGSSGSPLFDSNYQVVGALTGGNSYCYSPYNDYFYSLYYSWENTAEKEQQLKYWLAPNQTDRLCGGLDPYASAPALRLSHVFENGKYDLIETRQTSDSKYVFGLHDDACEYAEKYTNPGRVVVYGCYLVTPALSGRTGLDVDICLYAGKEKPETLLASQKFNPVYPYMENGNRGEAGKSLARSQENFVVWDTPVEVEGNFFIGYRINNTVDFCTHAVKEGEITQNTAWVKQGEDWKEVSAVSDIGFSTALFLDPVVSYQSDETANEPLAVQENILVSCVRSEKSIHLILPQNQPEATYVLVDSSGRIIDRQIIRESQTSWRYPNLPVGMYILSIQQGSQKYTRKIVF